MIRTVTAFLVNLTIWVTIAAGLGIGSCVLWAHWDAFLARRKNRT